MKPKNFIKNYLTGFFIGLILFTVVGVSAAAVFPSNQTTYNNGTTGMSATNVQTAIDELYNTCFPKAGEQIIEDAGLEKDPYECRYFFTGATPSNYITFNNETWRILSVECDSTIKIIRNAVLPDRTWDSSDSNNWARPASINTYLNENYLASTINLTAQSQIETKDWSVGGITYYNYTSLSNSIADENSKKWNGKIALPTVSEYLRSNSNTSSCGTYSSYKDNYSSCINTTWMYIYDDWWMLSPEAGSSHNVFRINNKGYFNSRYFLVSYSSAVRPVVYLSANIQITGGDGSQSNPYTIK